MARTLPAWKIEAAWSGQLTGVARVGTSTVGGADKVGGFFGGNVFDDLTTDVKRLEIERGRTGDLGVMQQGRCALVLHDPTGKYNPENPSSGLAGLLVPMRPLRVRATHLGTTYGRFYGFVLRIEHDPHPDVEETLIEAGDLFEWLAHAKPVIAATGATNVGPAIGKVLDAIQWTESSLRSLDSGHAIPDFSADGSKSGLDLIEDLLRADSGVCYVDGDGVATYRDTTSRWKRQAASPTALSGALMGSLRPSTDIDRIVNRQEVTRQGGVEQAASDSTSQANYGFREGGAITTPYLNTDSEAGNLARWLIQLQKDSQPPTRRIELANADDTLIATMLALDLQDRVTVTEGAGGTDTAGWVDGLSQEVLDGGAVDRVNLLVTKRRHTFATVGQSTVGSADIVGY